MVVWCHVGTGLLLQIYTLESLGEVGPRPMLTGEAARVVLERFRGDMFFGSARKFFTEVFGTFFQCHRYL